MAPSAATSQKPLLTLSASLDESIDQGSQIRVESQEFVSTSMWQRPQESMSIQPMELGAEGALGARQKSLSMDILKCRVIGHDQA